MGASGPGSSSQLYGELFKTMTGIEMAAVQYRGVGSALPDLMSGRLDVIFLPVATAVGQINAAKVRALASDRGVGVALDLPAAAPLRCDRDRVLQVLTNLLANALQVTPSGGTVWLGLRCAQAGAVFTVADDGPGIPAEDVPHLFERWYRGRRARYPGSGLGLAIARHIVEAHRGRIWVESQEGQGSAFSFELPWAPPAAGAAGA